MILFELTARILAAAPITFGMLVLIAIAVCGSSMEAFERRGWRATGWAIVAAALFALCAVVSRAEASSAGLGIGPN